jgi:hypothetical protein
MPETGAIILVVELDDRRMLIVCRESAPRPSPMFSSLGTTSIARARSSFM